MCQTDSLQNAEIHGHKPTQRKHAFTKKEENISKDVPAAAANNYNVRNIRSAIVPGAILDLMIRDNVPQSVLYCELDIYANAL